MDATEKRAIKCLLNNRFSPEWIMDKFNITEKEFSEEKFLLTKREKCEIVEKICKEYPNLSLSEKAEKAGMTYNQFSGIKSFLRIKEALPQPKEKDVGLKRAKDMYSLYYNGIYTLRQLSTRYAMTIYRVRKILSQYEKYLNENEEKEINNV